MRRTPRLRLRRPLDGFSVAGWPWVPDAPPPWTTTLVATWRPPRMDRVRFAGGTLLALAFAIGAFSIWQTRPGPGLLVPIAVAAWAGWGALGEVRHRRPDAALTLRLAPDRLHLSSSQPGALSVQIRRDEAGWLVAEEAALDRHVKAVTLFDDAGRPVGGFLGALADVRVEGEHEGLVPDASTLPTRVPASVLLGAWWPHPSRRMTRQGSLNARIPWKEPSITRFPSSERRMRLLAVAVPAFVGVLAIAAAWDASTAPAARFAMGVGGTLAVAWSLRMQVWRPSFLAPQAASRRESALGDG
jgi:hypothetical protein